MTRRHTGASSYRWVVLAIAVLVHATAIALVWQSVPPLKKAMAPDLGTTWERAVVVYAAFSLGLLVTQLPGGALGDRYRVRYVVGLGAVVTGVATAIRFAVPSLPAQVAVSVLATVGMGLVNPNLIKVVTEWFPRRQLGLGQGVLMAGNTLGSGLALSLSAGAVLAVVGSWQAVFAVYGGLTVAAGLLWLGFVRSPNATERPVNPATGVPFEAVGHVPLRESVPAVFRTPSTRWAILLVGLGFWAILGSLAVLPEFADAQPYRVPEFYLGTPLFLATAGALIIPVLSDRWSRRLGLALGVVGLSLGIAITGFAPSLSVFIIGLVVSGFFGGGLNAMFYLLPGELADVDPEHVGTMAGVILSLSNLGAVAATVTSAQVLSAFGVEAASLFVAVPVLLGLYAVVRLPFDRSTGDVDTTVAPGGDD